MPDRSIFDTIREQLKSHDVVLYMKGNADFPQCGFSAVVVQVLKNFGVSFVTFNILEDPDLRQGIKDFTDWPTIPQLYIKEEFIGGADIVRDLVKSGEFLSLLKEKEISHSLPQQ